jgi:hypothetical protein
MPTFPNLLLTAEQSVRVTPKKYEQLHQRTGNGSVLLEYPTMSDGQDSEKPIKVASLSMPSAL